MDHFAFSCIVKRMRDLINGAFTLYVREDHLLTDIGDDLGGFHPRCIDLLPVNDENHLGDNFFLHNAFI